MKQMIHIATVHWLDATWVDIQCRYFARCLGDTPYRLYAFLNGIEAEPYRRNFAYISTEPIVAHISKLNLLADEIGRVGHPEDIILFIDGDAFPVANFVPFLREQLKIYPLVAIQRLENEGDPQPHPCFCATTIKFWKEIKGDWSKGPKWQTNTGIMRSDTGGVLWEKLTKAGIAWKPILRSNAVNLHPLWFGVYGDLVYHHGAAFRTPYCSVDIVLARRCWWRRLILNLADIPAVSRLRGGWFQNAAYSFVMKKTIAKTLADSRMILAEIQSDEKFYRRFMLNA
ncbi:MAG: hypothetical protein HGB26_02345 [Desulfobulbaceae bacterium]|nr:hypothetical protein [Desulfobulbaceae bacterium]